MRQRKMSWGIGGPDWQQGAGELLMLASLALVVLLAGCRTPPAGPAAPAVAAASATPVPTSMVTATPLIPSATPTTRPLPTATAVLAPPSPTGVTGPEKLTAPGGAGTAAPTASPVPVPTAGVAELEAQTPARDLVTLAERLRNAAPPAEATPATAPTHPVGYHDTFYVGDQVRKRYFTVPATIRAETAHAYFYVQDDLAYDATGLEQAAQRFEAHTFPTDQAIFGPAPLPALDGDLHLTIVNALIPGVGGYFSAADEYPRSIIPFSNERSVIYVNTASTRIGTPGYQSTLAHELQHMIHWRARPHDDSWMNEGMSVLAQQLNGYSPGDVVPIFLAQPDVQLNAWAPSPTEAVPHYGAAFLFLDYLTEQYGGPASMRELLASTAPDLGAVRNFLGRHAPGTSLADFFARWVVANVVNSPTMSDGRYAYHDPMLHAAVDRQPLAAGQPRSEQVHQFAAHYYDVAPEALGGIVRFQGATTVPLLHQELPVGTREWWSNRADTMDSTLTRSVDLSSVASAHLDFSLWMDIEEAYDYCYVEASSDGGRSWQTLPGKYSTTTNPNGQNYGNGYTGSSAASAGADPTWVDESIDLSAFAGRQVLLRFEYVTDEAYSGPGVGLRAIRIPEIGYDDDRSGHGGWSSAGWLLTDDRVPERFVVQVLVIGSQTQVVRLSLDADNAGTLNLTGLDPAPRRVVVVVSALAPKTMESGRYTIEVDPVPAGPTGGEL